MNAPEPRPRPNRSEAAPAVSIDVERKTYVPVGGRAAHTVLRHVALDLAPRSFVVITGPSGCGKSTLLNIVAGLDTAYTGSINFSAVDPKLTFIFQTPRLLPWRTVEENISLVLPDDDPRRANIPDLLARVGLSGAETAYPERLSLGMQRRVAIARGFVVEPDILLMDEPFVSLDDATANGLRTLVVELWHRHKATIICVTHDRREAVRLATRVVQMGVLDDTMTSSIVGDQQIMLTEAERSDSERLTQVAAQLFGLP